MWEILCEVLRLSKGVHTCKSFNEFWMLDAVAAACFVQLQ